VGTVRLLERVPPSDPPSGSELSACLDWLGDSVARKVKASLEPFFKHRSADVVRLVGTGGTTTIMSKIESELDTFDRERIEATPLSRAVVEAQLRKLWSLPLAQRRTVTGLPPSRADVILMGVAIYYSLMDHFGFPELFVSTRGLRYAAVLSNFSYGAVSQLSALVPAATHFESDKIKQNFLPPPRCEA
jgi:exopolyphosphatase/guanosine-5'-triphosphate,3'-diphosphate pyrophosphatase